MRIKIKIKEWWLERKDNKNKEMKRKKEILKEVGIRIKRKGWEEKKEKKAEKKGNDRRKEMSGNNNSRERVIWKKTKWA